MENQSNLWIQETFVNNDKGYRYGETEPYETFTDNKGELFRHLQKEYGKAQKMYVDTKDGNSEHVGYVFTGKAQYEDTGETYSRSVWVTIFKEEPKKTIELEVEYA